MEKLVIFVTQNWYLFVAFFVIAFLLIASSIKRYLNGVSPIHSQRLLRLSNDDEAVIIDLRDLNQFNKGHIPHSQSIPLNEFDSKIKELEKFKDKSLILYCQNGTHAYQPAVKLKKNGFPQVYYLNTGISGWQQDNLPLSKSK